MEVCVIYARLHHWESSVWPPEVCGCFRPCGPRSILSRRAPGGMLARGRSDCCCWLSSARVVFHATAPHAPTSKVLILDGVAGDEEADALSWRILGGALLIPLGQQPQHLGRPSPPHRAPNRKATPGTASMCPPKPTYGAQNTSGGRQERLDPGVIRILKRQRRNTRRNDREGTPASPGADMARARPRTLIATGGAVPAAPLPDRNATPTPRSSAVARPQYFRINPISRPWILTRSGPKMRVS